MRFFAGFAVAVLGIAVTIGGANVWLDPYSVFPWSFKNGVTPLTYKQRAYIRERKMTRLRLVRPQWVILGSSRTEIGMSTKHPAITTPAYNLSVPGLNHLELPMWVSTAAEHGAKEFLIGLDFFGANAELDVSTVVRNADWPLLLRYLSVIDMRGTLEIAKVRFGISQPEDYAENLDGQLIPLRQVPPEGYRQAAIKGELNAASVGYFAGPEHRYGFHGRSGDTLQAYSSMLVYAHKNRITLHLCILPAQARDPELVYQLGLWHKLEDWKRELVRRNEQAARDSKDPPFELWDFSGFNPITTEVMPPRGDTQTAMHYFWDVGHFRDNVGRLMLNRLFPDHQMGGESIPQDFGFHLSPDNIEGWLAASREAHSDWRAAHPQDVEEIAASVETAAARRHRPAVIE